MVPAAIPAAKAWVAAAAAFVTQVAAAVQLVVADEAVSLTEAKGLLLLATEGVGLLAGFLAVFRTGNAPTPQ